MGDCRCVGDKFGLLRRDFIQTDDWKLYRDWPLWLKARKER